MIYPEKSTDLEYRMPLEVLLIETDVTTEPLLLYSEKEVTERTLHATLVRMVKAALLWMRIKPLERVFSEK